MILDVDKTALDNGESGERTIRERAAYNETRWAVWCNERRAVPIPGALLEAAQMDAAPGRQEWKGPATNNVYSGLDASVAVFIDKRSQTAVARCGGS